MCIFCGQSDAGAGTRYLASSTGTGTGGAGLDLPTAIASVLWPINGVASTWWTADKPRYTLTYEFESSQPGDLWNSFSGWRAFTEAEKAAVRSALDEVSSIINVSYQEVVGASDPDMNFGRVSLSYGGQGGFRYNYGTDGSGNLSSRVWDGYAVWNGNRDITTLNSRGLLLHEIGHSLGLKHAGDYDVAGSTQPGPFLPADYDTTKYTVMSYNDDPSYARSSDHYMPFDIAALQARWGANMSYRAGNDSYTAPRGGVIDTIWDAGGRDTIDASGYSGGVAINLTAGSYSSLGASDNLAIAYGVTIENATGGAGADTITGNSAANQLRGNGGNDTINGGGGLDVALMAGTRAQSTVTLGASTVVAGPDGRDTLINVERIGFSDAVLALDLDGTAGQTYRLYQAAFARTPDLAGLSHNVRLEDQGLTLQQMSAAFIGSAEFQKLYGTSPTDTDYINALYHNVLGRGPDSAGLAGWQQRLADGSWTRPDVLIGFSESPENRALVLPAIQNGILLDLGVLA